MMSKLRLRPRLVLLMILVLVISITGWYRLSVEHQRRITAYFSSATSVYAGDDVRVLGVKVGAIDAIEPGGQSTKVTMSINSEVKLPLDVKAVIMSPNLVSARFIQLTPVYISGPTIADGQEISLSNTAIPVEWDDIKTELTKLSAALDTQVGQSQGSLGNFVNTAADVLDGKGQSIKETIKQLSSAMQTLSDGRGDLFSTVKNLAIFVKALSASDNQIVSLSGHLASVSTVLGESSNHLDMALSSLEIAIRDLGTFISENRDRVSDSVKKLGDATQVLAHSRPQLEQILHVAPTALSNFYNVYQPAQGSLTGAIALANAANPLVFLCGSISGLANATSDRSAELCRQYLSPVVNSLLVNYPGILLNPVTGVDAFPDQIQYSQPELESAARQKTSPSAQDYGYPTPKQVDGPMGFLLPAGAP
ncbi:MAG: MCE family protein [Mycobacteriaceae bacterium]